MSYNTVTDFLGLVRKSGNSAALADMPGLDYVVAAMARMGVISLSVGQSAPIVNQPTTVWLKPALPSWTAEGVVFIWNSATGQYEVATPALWKSLLSPNQYVFQSVTGISATVNSDTSLLAIQRAAPAATTLQLPSIASRNLKPLQVVDWSTAVALHAITLVAALGSTIMRLPAFQIISTPDQLAGMTLIPSPNLNGWIIAP